MLYFWEGRLWIEDGLVNQDDTWSSQKISDEIDAAIEGLDWIENVLSRFDPTGGLPVGPSVGDRYLSTGTANGWTTDYIYEWDGAAWDEQIPDDKTVTNVADENPPYGTDYLYITGTGWVQKSTGIQHNLLFGLQGGAPNEYYHLTTTEHSALTSAGGVGDAAAQHHHDSQYYTETELDAGQLDNRYYTETELDSGALDPRYYTETELDAGQLDNRYYTETELDPLAAPAANVLDARYYTETEIDATFANYYTAAQLDAGQLDNRYYTETELDAGQLDNRYYTETELDAGQLDNRYYTETEIDATFALYYTAAQLDAGQLDNRYYTETELDAGQLDNRYYTETELDAGQLDNRYYTEAEMDEKLEFNNNLDLPDEVTIDWLKTMSNDDFVTTGGTVEAVIETGWAIDFSAPTEVGTAVAGVMSSGGAHEISLTAVGTNIPGPAKFFFIANAALDYVKWEGGSLANQQFDYLGDFSGSHVYRFQSDTGGTADTFKAFRAAGAFTAQATFNSRHPFDLNGLEVKDGGITMTKLSASLQAKFNTTAPETVIATTASQTVFNFSSEVGSNPVVAVDGVILQETEYTVTGPQQITLDTGVPVSTKVYAVAVGDGSGEANPDWASQIEAEAGTATDKLMSPLRVKQAIDEFAGGISVNVTGTPVDNQVAVWTDSNTLEGDANLTWDGAEFTINGKLTVTGLIDPTGIELVPQASNPGNAFTLWFNSADGNKLYTGTGSEVAVAGVTAHSGLTNLNADDHTQYLLVDGTRAMTGPIYGPDGTQGAPTYSFANATDMGMFAEPFTPALHFVTNGGKMLTIDSSTAEFFGALIATEYYGPIAHFDTLAPGTLTVHAATPQAGQVFIENLNGIAKISINGAAFENIATEAYVDAAVSAEDFWNRAATTISPVNAGDNLDLGTGTLSVDNINSLSLPDGPVVVSGGQLTPPQNPINPNGHDEILVSGNPEGQFNLDLGTVTMRTLNLEDGLSIVTLQMNDANSRFEVIGQLAHFDSGISGTLVDGVVATTQSPSDNSTKVATTAYVDAAVSAGDYWDRTGTILSTQTAGDSLSLDGSDANMLSVRSSVVDEVATIGNATNYFRFGTNGSNIIWIDGFGAPTMQFKRGNQTRFQISATTCDFLNGTSVDITMATASTSSTTGALIVTGGVGVGGDLYLATKLAFDAGVSIGNSGTGLVASNSIAVGSNAAQGYTGGGVIAIGASTCQNLGGARVNLIAIGSNAMRLGNGGHRSIAIGAEALEDNTSTYSIAIGEKAGKEHAGGNNNMFLGSFAGENNISGSGNVFLGHAAGQNETGSDLLYIANSNTATPLIKGDFAGNQVDITGGLSVSTLNTGDNIITTDTSGNLQESGAKVETTGEAGSMFSMVNFTTAPTAPANGDFWFRVEGGQTFFEYRVSGVTKSVELA